ncbi:hypothetical protein PPERSA_06169 [Pseudocohnilembus persalinus]|uniref:EGF-like domain-containing protein n=1 Tax=Pseudocohnilembus persalinus TaxID=266149 RepID=A0A0V0R0C2_PSEPJ|nr:hypothetical protein PPERSA_06169 [Pseudocohnilembus persalinus]|eukprot:KRX07991.1 hypothetical protein PPERSA_06169 [Pseudocohnilembus persalinus]
MSSNSHSIEKQQNKILRNLQIWNCPTGTYANIYYTYQSGSIQKDCIDVNRFKKSGVTCQQYILVYRQQSVQPDYYDEICIKCNSNQFNCECDTNQYYNYDNSQCQNCPTNCQQCAYDKFGANSVYCFECIDPYAVGPECYCQQNYFYYVQSGVKTCKTCQEIMGQDYYLDYTQKNDNCIYNNNCSIQDICKQASSINDYCIKSTDHFDNTNSRSICTQCSGNNRVLPDCNCKQEYIYESPHSLNCVACDTGQFYSQVKYNQFCSTSNINNNQADCYKQNICIDCINEFSKCSTCDEQQCLQCQGTNRVLPNCECVDNYLTDPLNKQNCIQCPTGKYLNPLQTCTNDEQDLQSAGCSYDELCIDIIQINNFCTDVKIDFENDTVECIECDGANRYPPNCMCYPGYVPDSLITKNCVQCQNDEYFSLQTFDIKCINDFNDEIQCVNNEICKPCNDINQFCDQCKEESGSPVCTKCQGDRILPDCLCQDYYLPVSLQSQNCQYCDESSGKFYNQDKFNIDCQPNDYTTCDYNSICQDCVIFHPLCILCNQDKCLECQGDRLAPDCTCPQYQLPVTQNSQFCDICPQGKYYEMTIYNSNCQNTFQDYGFQCKIDDICISCSDKFEFCSKCTINQCIECIGQNRVLPNCGCKENYVPNIPDSQPYECIKCDDTRYYDTFQNTFCSEIDKYNQIQNCQYTDLCIDFTDINPYCTNAIINNGVTVCVQCVNGSRVPPDCFCFENTVPSNNDSSICKSCDSGYYYSLQHDNCVQQIKYDCVENDICLSCKNFNPYCETCSSSQCQVCEGNRYSPYCKCPNQMVASRDNPQLCSNCLPNQYYNQDLDTCRFNLDDGFYECYSDEFCVDCTSYNIFCTSCNSQQCLTCEGSRNPPFCKCSENKAPISNDSLKQCVDCSYGYQYIQEKDKCRHMANDGEYTCLQDDVCISCQQLYNPFCTNCNSEQCLTCEGNRNPPYCKCAQNKAPVSFDSLEQCVDCSYGYLYIEQKDKCRHMANDGEYSCINEFVCVSCSILYNPFCLSCNQDDGCTKCQGNRIPPYCKCQLGYVTSNQLSEICVQCSSDSYYDQIKDKCRSDLQEQQSSSEYQNNIKCTENDVCTQCYSTMPLCNKCIKNEENLEINCSKCLGDLQPIYQYKKILNGQSLTFNDCGCPEGFYTFENQSMKCNSCKSHSTCLGLDIIQVDQGYWRKSTKSDVIIECKNNKDACVGGTDDFVCAEGYMGALCEMCDNHAQIWDKNYGSSEQYNCQVCEYFFSTAKIIGYAIAILSLTIFLNYQGIQEVRDKITENNLSLIFKDKTQFNVQKNDKQLTAVFKIFMQYFASISILTQMDIVDLSFFDTIIQNTGSPGKVIGMTVDCYARFIGQGFPTVYLRIVYMCMQFIFYVLGSIIFFKCFKKKLFKTKQKITYTPNNIKNDDLSQQDGKKNNNVNDQSQQQCGQQQNADNIINDSDISNQKLQISNKYKKKQYMNDEIIDPSPTDSLLLTKTFIFLFIDIQPSFIQIIIDSISCKQIGETSYLINDTTLECNSQVKQKFTYLISLPMFILWGFVIPALLALQLRIFYKTKYNNKKLKQNQGKVKPIFQIQQDQSQETENRIFYYQEVNDNQNLLQKSSSNENKNDSYEDQSQQIQKKQINDLTENYSIQCKDDFYQEESKVNARQNSLILDSFCSYEENDLDLDKDQKFQQLEQNQNHDQ